MTTNASKHLVKNRYYHLWIAAAKDQVFFASNIDKAYFTALLQDHLSPRIGSEVSFPATRNNSPEVDLIVYSLTDFGVNMLVYATDNVAVDNFGQAILTDYASYLNQQNTWEVLPFDTIFTYDHLADEHEALSISREIHLLHDDWRNDRYSSIGFYLDDRRGDWVQAWRLADLFNNDSAWYQDFLMDNGSLEVGSLQFLET